MIDISKSEQLRTKALAIRNDATIAFKQAVNRAIELEKMANLLEFNRDDLKASRVDAFEAVATQIESEWLQQILMQRIAMRDRGEDISVPESIEALKIELSKQEQE